MGSSPLIVGPGTGVSNIQGEQRRGGRKGDARRGTRFGVDGEEGIAVEEVAPL